MALTSQVAAVRDSKNAAGPSLEFTPAAWRSFLEVSAPQVARTGALSVRCGLRRVLEGG